MGYGQKKQENFAARRARATGCGWKVSNSRGPRLGGLPGGLIPTIRIMISQSSDFVKEKSLSAGPSVSAWGELRQERMDKPHKVAAVKDVA